jgi:hypothetical protein
MSVTVYSANPCEQLDRLAVGGPVAAVDGIEIAALYC